MLEHERRWMCVERLPGPGRQPSNVFEREPMTVTCGARLVRRIHESDGNFDAPDGTRASKFPASPAFTSISTASIP